MSSVLSRLVYAPEGCFHTFMSEQNGTGPRTRVCALVFTFLDTVAGSDCDCSLFLSLVPVRWALVSPVPRAPLSAAE